MVAAGVTENAADYAQLLPMEPQARNNTGVRAQIVVADYGYGSEENFAALEQRGVDPYVAMGKATSERARKRQGLKGPCTRRMRRKLAGERGRRIFAARKAIVEPALGWIKNILGFRSFSMRGLHQAVGGMVPGLRRDQLAAHGHPHRSLSSSFQRSPCIPRPQLNPRATQGILTAI
jgi:hypothetical protein